LSTRLIIRTPFVEVDQAHVEVAAIGRLAPHGGHRVHGAHAAGRFPFQRGAAAMRAALARVVHVLAAIGAALDQEAAGIEFHLVEGLHALGVGHGCLRCAGFTAFTDGLRMASGMPS
jgi:hypothetical protein